jgi:hypothetical protein
MWAEHIYQPCGRLPDASDPVTERTRSDPRAGKGTSRIRAWRPRKSKSLARRLHRQGSIQRRNIRNELTTRRCVSLVVTYFRDAMLLTFSDVGGYSAR